MKYIVITGASKGLGKALSRSFADKVKGCCLALTYNTDLNGISEIASELSNEGFFVVPVKMDVTDYNDVKLGFEYIYKCFPRIDLLINNAGVSLVKPFSFTTFDDWQRVIDVNLNGAFRTVKEVIDKMNGEGGMIFNVTSVWGEVGASCEVAYSSAKAGLIGLTRALQKEYEVTLRAISVGFVDTAMNSHMTKDDLMRFFEENPQIKLRTPKYTADKIVDLAINLWDKPVNADEDVLVRIW